MNPRRLMAMSVLLFSAVALFFLAVPAHVKAQCPNFLCSRIECADGQEGWTLIYGEGYDDNVGVRGQRCPQSCFVWSCTFAKTSASKCVESPEDIIAIAHLRKHNEGVLVLSNIRRKDAKAIAKELDSYLLAHNLQDATLRFASTNHRASVLPYQQYEALLRKDVQQIVAGTYTTSPLQNGL